jgi:hypothetical protein
MPVIALTFGSINHLYKLLNRHENKFEIKIMDGPDHH